MTRDGEANVLIIKFKNRLSRFGLCYLEKYVKDFVGEIAIVEDMLAIVSSFSARLCGNRSQKFRKQVGKLSEEQLGNEHGKDC